MTYRARASSSAAPGPPPQFAPRYPRYRRPTRCCRWPCAARFIVVIQHVVWRASLNIVGHDDAAHGHALEHRLNENLILRMARAFVRNTFHRARNGRRARPVDIANAGVQAGPRVVGVVFTDGAAADRETASWEQLDDASQAIFPVAAPLLYREQKTSSILLRATRGCSRSRVSALVPNLNAPLGPGPRRTFKLVAEEESAAARGERGAILSPQKLLNCSRKIAAG